MNRVFAPKTMKIIKNSYLGGLPPQGLFLGTAGQEGLLYFLLLIRRGGVPPGAAAFIIPEE